MIKWFAKVYSYNRGTGISYESVEESSLYRQLIPLVASVSLLSILIRWTIRRVFSLSFSKSMLSLSVVSIKINERI